MRTSEERNELIERAYQLDEALKLHELPEAARDCIRKAAENAKREIDAEMRVCDDSDFDALFGARDAIYRAECGLTPDEISERRMEARMLGETDSIWY